MPARTHRRLDSPLTRYHLLVPFSSGASHSPGVAPAPPDGPSPGSVWATVSVAPRRPPRAAQSSRSLHDVDLVAHLCDRSMSGRPNSGPPRTSPPRAVTLDDSRAGTPTSVRPLPPRPHQRHLWWHGDTTTSRQPCSSRQGPDPSGTALGLPCAGRRPGDHELLPAGSVVPRRSVRWAPPGLRPGRVVRLHTSTSAATSSRRGDLATLPTPTSLLATNTAVATTDRRPHPSVVLVAIQSSEPRLLRAVVRSRGARLCPPLP